MPASALDWVGLAFVSLALSLIAVVLFFIARHIVLEAWRRLHPA